MRNKPHAGGLTLANTQIVERPGRLLNNRERRRRAQLLESMMRRAPCPSCSLEVSIFAAAGVELDQYDPAREHPYRCPGCAAELRPDGDGWRLARRVIRLGEKAAPAQAARGGAR